MRIVALKHFQNHVESKRESLHMSFRAKTGLWFKTEDLWKLLCNANVKQKLIV